MAITKERKSELLDTYTQLLSQTDGFIVTEYRGLTVAKLNDLRKRLVEGSNNGSYAVTKNTIFQIALEKAGWPVPESLLVGPTAVVFGNGNLAAAAKTVMAFQKENQDLFIVKGGVLSGAIFGAKDVEAVSNLPTLDDIRAQLAGLVVAPASQLAGLLEAATSQVVNVLHAYVDKDNDGAAA